MLISFVLIFMYGTENKLQARSGDIFFETLSPDLGLSQITVSCIYQDTKGLMWFGTQYGLNRFDGYGINVFENVIGKETSISHNSINGITEDQNGYLWIATENGLNVTAMKKMNSFDFLKRRMKKESVITKYHASTGIRRTGSGLERNKD